MQHLSESGVRFFNVRYSYMCDESLLIHVRYAPHFRPLAADWIGVMPAGFIRPTHFSALKMAPRPPDAWRNPRALCCSRPAVTADRPCSGEMLPIVFRAAEARLAPRHFYQFAYVRRFRREQRIIATSCVFYVESSSNSHGDNPPTMTNATHAVRASLSMQEFGRVPQKPGGVAVTALKEDNSLPTSADDGRRTSCSILFKNLLCGAPPSFGDHTPVSPSMDTPTSSASDSSASSIEVFPFRRVANCEGGGMDDSGVDDCCGEANGVRAPLLNRSPFDAPLEAVKRRRRRFKAETNGRYRKLNSCESRLNLDGEDKSEARHSLGGKHNSTSSGSSSSVRASIVQFFGDLFGVSARPEPLSENRCGERKVKEPGEAAPLQHRRPLSMYELGANALHILGATHNSSSSSTSSSLIGHHHRPPSCHDMLSPSSVATASSTSSTVSLSFPSATCAGGGACASPQHHEQELHYQKMICQLTISNSNLMHETEALKMKLTRMQFFLNDHIQHLNSVYYTLFCNGYSALHLPDGDQVHLSQFRGALLNFVGGPSASGERCLKQDHHTLKERTSDLSSDSSISSADADELKNAMLKCITRSKYDDIDEFVSWLSRDTTTAANAVSSNSSTPLDGCSSTIVNTCQMVSDNICHNNGLPTSSASGFRCPHQPQVKSRSLEDELERRLRISRSPLRRTSRIDQITTAYQQQQQRQQQQQQQQQQYWSSKQQKSSQQLHQQQHPQQNFLRASARALSESELRRPTSCATSLPINYAVETYSVPSVLPLQPQPQQQHGVQLNGGGSSVGQQLNVPTTSPTVNVTPNPAPPVSGSMSARTAKSKTARLRAQSVHSAKIGGILGGGVGSSRRSAMEKEKSAAAAAATRKSLTPMRSPILTLGRAPPPKAGRNLI